VIQKPEWGPIGPLWSGTAARTVIDLVQQAAERFSDSPAMIFEDGLVVNYRTLLGRAERFAGYLQHRVAPGERVAVMIGNRTEHMLAWLAIVAIRGTMVAVNPAARAHDAGHVLRDSGAVMAVIEAEHRPLIDQLRAECPALREVVVVGEPEPDGLLSVAVGTKSFRFASSATQRDDIINIYYTSGTTGPPKGCMVDHEWWLRTVDVVLRLNPWTPDDRVLCCLQFYYSDPGNLLLTALKCGGAMVVTRKFSVSRFWDVVRDNRVTVILGIGAIPVMLLKASPSHRDRAHHVKRAIQLAIPPNLHQALVSRWGFPWLEGYGITEGNVLAAMPMDHATEMIGSGSMGVPVPEVSLKIVDGHGHEVPVAVTGEVLAKGPGMMRGYLNQPQATRETLVDGWLRTGDLARVDERGFLYFVGRTKDIIRRSGENVAATEVENVLKLHPKIMDAAVIAVPDEIRGEEIKAYVILVKGESPDTVPPEEISCFCSAKLAAYKVPRYLEYRTEDFPRTASMRVQKELLRSERADLVAGVWDRTATRRSAGRSA